MEEPNAEEEMEQGCSESETIDGDPTLTPAEQYCFCINSGTDPAICLTNYREAMHDPTAPIPPCD